MVFSIADVRRFEHVRKCVAQVAHRNGRRRPSQTGSYYPYLSGTGWGKAGKDLFQMQNNADWMLLCSRLDIVLMGVYQTANIVIALWFLLPLRTRHMMETMQQNNTCE